MYFINSADVVIAFVSTFTLDVQIFDKPVINIYYDLIKTFGKKSEL